MNHNHDIHIAAAPQSILLLKKNFSESLTYHLFPSYNITYGEKHLVSSILLQIPKILSTIQAEHRALKDLCKQFNFDLIISDNRYGMYHPEITSIFMTHQMQVLSGMHSLLDKIGVRLHAKLMSKFRETWIVDAPPPLNLAGKLSAPASMPSVHYHYIGHLSQFEQSHIPTVTNNNKIVLLLSGPEPSRTILLEKVYQQAQQLSEYTFHLITGNDDDINEYEPMPHIHIYGMAEKKSIESILQDAALIVCRSGYSTIMDMLKFRIPLLLIPTPGQTEQMYLAQHLSNTYNIFTSEQAALDMSSMIPSAMNAGSYMYHDVNTNQGFIDRLRHYLQ